MTTCVGSVEKEPPRGHPPASRPFSASPGHTGLCLPPGLVLNPKGRYDTNFNVKKKSHQKLAVRIEKAEHSPKVLCGDLLLEYEMNKQVRSIF